MEIKSRELKRGRLASRQGSGEVLSDDAIRLASRLYACSDKNQAILFTGASKQDNISPVGFQAAHALAAMDDGPVLFVDANHLAPWLCSDPRQTGSLVGLFELIAEGAELTTAIRASEIPNLFLMTAGTSAVDHRSLLLSDELRKLMKLLRQEYRFIVVNSAPIFFYPEFLVLASRTDGVVLAVMAGKQKKAQVAEIGRRLEELNLPFFGVVLCEQSTRP